MVVKGENADLNDLDIQMPLRDGQEFDRLETIDSMDPDLNEGVIFDLPILSRKTTKKLSSRDVDIQVNS